MENRIAKEWFNNIKEWLSGINRKIDLLIPKDEWWLYEYTVKHWIHRLGLENILNEWKCWEVFNIFYNWEEHYTIIFRKKINKHIKGDIVEELIEVRDLLTWYYWEDIKQTIIRDKIINIIKDLNDL